MNPWILSILLLFAFALLLGLATRTLVCRTGYTKKPALPWSLLGPVGAGCAVFVAGLVFNLSVPWLVLVAGIAAGAFQFIAQAICSYRDV